MIEKFELYLYRYLNISADQFARLRPLFVTKTAHRKANLLVQGERHKCGFFVLSGCLRTLAGSAENEYTLQFAPEHTWLFNEHDLWANEPSYIGIQAIERSEVIIFEQEFLKELARMLPSGNLSRLCQVQNSSVSLQERIVDLLSVSVKDRYQKFRRMYPGLEARIPRGMLARYLGILPQSLSRISHAARDERQNHRAPVYAHQKRKMAQPEIEIC